MSPADLLLIQRMRAIGMRMPVRTLQAARACGLNVPLACAVLMQETGGGINEYGHDDTVAVGWGIVTEANYRAYVRLRDQHGHGSRCQGVGPCQLTYVGFQDKADRLGGCWRPAINLRVGFETLTANVRHSGLWHGVQAYNGSGPAAEHYAETVIARARGYASRLRLPAP